MDAFDFRRAAETIEQVEPEKGERLLREVFQVFGQRAFLQLVLTPK